MNFYQQFLGKFTFTVAIEKTSVQQPKNAKKKAAGKSAKAVAITLPLPNTDEAEVDEPGPEVEWNNKGAHRKRRSMYYTVGITSDSNFLPPEHAPVVISENEHSESEHDTKDKIDEVDTENGTKLIHIQCTIAYSRPCTDTRVPLRKNRKRKCTLDPSSDELSETEVDNFTVCSTLPRIQSQSHQANNHQHRATRLIHSSLPVTPHHSPKSPDRRSPHAITNDESQSVKCRKPVSKRTLKALQTAKAEVCWFVDQLREHTDTVSLPGAKVQQRFQRRSSSWEAT